MAYQALLFCPEEKTARTVTQVLSELEFSVEPCSEPFAAVKKLMGQHFDAIVVDCDNEQNATLLFKSARNSTSNQASLAVAIVEGQAGVAKAFRIGANLVLTKPINVEQSKGTLRVARGLLRKGEPIKAPMPAAPAPAAQNAPPAAPKPVAPKPVAAAKTEVPVSPVTPTARPASPPPVKPPTSLPAARAAVAKSALTPQGKAPVAGETGARLAPTPTSAPSKPVIPPAAVGASSANVFETPAPMAKPKPAVTAESMARGSAAAAAPAPARQPEPAMPEPASKVEAAPVKTRHKAEDLFEKPAEEAAASTVSVDEPSSPRAESVPSFTFGGGEEEGGGVGKKIGIGIAAVLVVGAGLYFVLGRSQKHSAPAPTITATNAPTSATASAPTTMAAGAPGTNPVSAAPAKPSPEPVNVPTESKPLAEKSTAAASSDTNANDAEDSSDTPAPKPTTASSTPSKSAGAAPAKPEAAPLVVKSGTAPVHRAAPAPEASAPSIEGIAATGSNGALSNIVSSESSPFQPVLQTLSVSQGVSQGLLLKKVQPIYPKAALAMHIEGPVELEATISKTGAITSVKVMKGNTQLSKAAVDAVKQWKYKPYLLDGEPVEIQTQITVVFKLPS